MNPATELLTDAGHTVLAAQPISGGDICRAWQVTTDRGQFFAKSPRTPAPSMLRLEAAGLDWLREGGLLTPDVVAVSEDCLVLEWMDTIPATPAAAETFGRALAQLHETPADSFGCAPGEPSASDGTGYVGSLPVPLGSWPDWPTFYVEARLRPTLHAATGSVSLQDREMITRLCEALETGDERISGPTVTARRIHGDLWSGNVMWTTAGPAVVDSAAHGGHPETDLAMLHLFGVPYLEEILTGYTAVRPLSPGWRSRIPLHQLFPVLVHATLFGGSYGRQAGRLAAMSLNLG